MAEFSINAYDASLLDEGLNREPAQPVNLASVRSRGAVLATRNAQDFEGCDPEIVNPWGGVL